MAITTATRAVDAPAAAPPDTARGLAYRPGLDGLRALALLAVLAFHHGWPGAPGGYLGVSAFFTLSGFLITTLALLEWQRTGRLSWRRFWERRARRLLPAAVVTLAGVLVLQAWAETGSGPRFRGDVLAALGYGANWRLAQGDGGYADLFAEPSPVVHFWSLAIEEQFYLAFPLVFAGVMALLGGARRRGAAIALFGAAALASFAVAWVSASRYGNDGLTYYGTHTRAGELLVGVTLAFVLFRPGRVQGAAAGRARGWALDLAGVAALAGLAWLWHSVAIGERGLFHGVTALNALLTGLVVAAVVGPGRLDRALGVGPLRAVGKVSYAAYLFHWPLFLVLTPRLVGVTGPRLWAVRVAATLVAAAVSYVVIEAPFRFRLPMPRPRLAGVATAGAAAVVGLAFVLPQHGGAYADLAAAEQGGGAPGVGGDGGGGLKPATNVRAIAAVAPPDGVAATDTVFMVGDSVAYSLGVAFHFWNTRGPERAFQVDNHISFGCPIGGPGVVRGTDEHDTSSDCETWRTDLPRALAASSPDVVVMVMGLLDLNGREIDGEWRELGDPVHDRWLRGQIDEVATLLEAPGVPVMWMTFPHVRAKDRSDPTRAWDTLAINEPAKVDRFNELLAEVAAEHDGIELVDLAGWLDTWPEQSFEPDMRDGIHFSYAGADKVGSWLIPQVLAKLEP
ncbi:MAG TPA: acyltransferase family protein [Acidimicrobiales bacterium]|nr:acyltransferase family protein [Acidimicrobiales bacterium]